MRYRELYESDPQALGIYNPEEDFTRHYTSSRKPRLTLRHLNKLKKIRNIRRRDLKAKLDFYPTIYGNPERLSQQSDLDAQKAELEFEADRLAIQNEIEKAELDNEQRDKISAMALRAIKQRQK